MMNEQQLSYNNYKIYYYTAGDKQKPCIVLLHPAFGSHACFEQQFEQLKEDFHIIALDMMGHGKSQITKSKDQIDSSIHHLQEILEQEEIRYAHIVAVSAGALIAQYFALHYPQKVLSLSLIGAYDIYSKNKAILKAQRWQNLKMFLMSIFSMQRLRRYVANQTVIHPQQRERFFQIAQDFKFRSFIYMQGLGKIINQKEQSPPDIPVQILIGDQDIPIVKEKAKEWAKNYKYHYLEIENAGHCANMDQPEMIRYAIFNFIQKHSA